MHKSYRSVAALCLLSLLGGTVLSGCGGEKTEMSKEDEKNFKGTGVMPPGAAAAIAKQKADAQAKGGGAPGAPAAASNVPGVDK